MPLNILHGKDGAHNKELSCQNVSNAKVSCDDCAGWELGKYVQISLFPSFLLPYPARIPLWGNPTGNQRQMNLSVMYFGAERRVNSEEWIRKAKRGQLNKQHCYQCCAFFYMPPGTPERRFLYISRSRIFHLTSNTILFSKALKPTAVCDPYLLILAWPKVFYFCHF